VKDYTLKISAKVNLDFESILQYTLTEHGELQMIMYSDKIFNAFKIIKSQPYLGIFSSN